MTIRKVKVTIVHPVSFVIELDDTLSVEARQGLIHARADEFTLDDPLIHDCSDPDLIE